MRREDWLRTLSWLLPLASCLIAGGLVLWQYMRANTIQKESDSTLALIGSLKQSIGQWQSDEGREKIPYALDTKLEEAMFLDGVRQKALQRGVKLVKWVNEPPKSAGDDQTGVRGAANSEELPEALRSVRTLISNVEVEGSYEGVRAFVKDLLASNRLLTLKTGVWDRGEKATANKFNFKLHRYISSTPPAGIPAANASSSVSSKKAQG